MNFEKAGAQWIWVPKTEGEDQYADFMTDVSLDTVPETAEFIISVDSDYAVWINGRFVDAGHYDDFSWDRTHDTLPAASFLQTGKNRIAVQAYYQGRSSHQYLKGAPGVIFGLVAGEEVLAVSDSGTLCRTDPVFRTGSNPLISAQIGFTFDADGRQEDGWRDPGYQPDSWKRAQVMTGELYKKDTRPRPVKKLELKARLQPEITAQGRILRTGAPEDNSAARMYTDFLSPVGQQELFATGLEALTYSGEVHMGREPLVIRPEAYADCDGFYLILDNGREEAGLFRLDIDAPEGIDVEVAWGQHLNDLRVRSFIGGRHFAARYTTREGRQRFFFPFRRMGGRYIELHIMGKGPVTLHYAGILPWEYPVEYRGSFTSPDSLHNRIWEVSRRTLELCMHEHYEDTPWREQAFYVADSRNQALCGYYAFGEYQFPEATFGLYKDAFTSPLHADICAPSGSGLCIPAFVLNWPVTVYEQWMYSGSLSLAEACWPRITGMLADALSRFENGLMKTPGEPGMWNFYEWSEGLSDRIDREHARDIRRLEAPLQLFLLNALKASAALAGALGDTENAALYGKTAESLAKKIHEVFWQPERGLYATFKEDGKLYHEAELTQALALYAGIVPAAEQDGLREKLAAGTGLVPCTLSYSIFKYDALLSGGDRWARPAFDTVARDWGMMLYKDSTSFWETILGQKDFGYAGSLCHGWSAVPLYLYSRYVLGVYPVEAGFKTFAVEPLNVFTEVSGTVPTPAGDIHVTVRNGKKGADVEVDAPDTLTWR